MNFAVATLDGNCGRQPEHVPDLFDPRTGADDDGLAIDIPLIGDYRLHSSARILLEPGDLTPVRILTPSRSAFFASPRIEAPLLA